MADQYETPDSPEAEKHERARRLKLWKDRIARAKKLREDWETEWKVKELENFYLGKQNKEAGDTVFNYFLATLKAEEPELFFTNPTFLVRPKPGNSGPASDRQSARAQGVLQSIAAQDSNLEESGELATLQSYFRVGVLKSVYDPTLEPNPRAGQPIYMHQEDDSPIVNPETQQPVPLIDPQTQQPVSEPAFVVQDEVYRWEWVDARKMLLPDQGPDMRKWTWIGEEVSVPLEEAKKDERFDKDRRAQLKSNRSRDPEKDGGQNSADSENPDDDLFSYCECYDIKNKRWYIYADGQEPEEFLLDDVFPDGIEDHPYSILRFTPILGPKPSPWPLPETASWLPIQKEYNIRRQQITEGAKRSARKIYFDEGTFDDETEALKALQSNKDMEAVKVTSIKNVPVINADPSQTPDLYKDVQLLQGDYRLIAGQTGARLGDPDANTATEATYAERASNARTADKRKVVARWLRRAGTKMLQLVKGTMTLDKWILLRGFNDKEVAKYAEQVYGLNPMMMKMFSGIKDILIERLGEKKWVQTTREDLTFEADVEIVAGSSRPRTLDVERQQFKDILMVIGQFPQLLMSYQLLKKLQASYEFIDDETVDELHALAQKMMAASANVAGRSGDNAQGGGDGPSAAANLLTAVTGAGMAQ